MLKKFIRVIGGDPNKRIIEKFAKTAEQINALEADFEQLSNDSLRAKTSEFRSYIAERINDIEDEKERQAAEQDALYEILPEAFATVREVSKRTIGLRHYDVQLIGGINLHLGRIAEMRTGEGKTLVATLPVYLNALTGHGVHLITVNDYLARRDARWMAPIYNALDLSIGVLQMASRTENGKKAFLVDLTHESPHEDQHQLRLVSRREAYAADITYGTNSEFGFDYLRDNMTYSLEARTQRGKHETSRHYYAIIDEVDNVLIDEARTPLIISGPASDDVQEYYRMAQVVRQLRSEDIELNERDRNVTLTEIGDIHVEELLGVPLRDPERPEDVTPEQARLMGYLEQAIRAQYLFRRNKEYLVQGGKVIIVDEFTGRLMPGRRWSDGLHQAVEAKEGVKVEAENVTYATITIQNYFRMYQKLAGMSGTALTEAEEFHKIYELEVLPLPTNLEYQASHPDSSIIEADSRDPNGYKYRYYTLKDDPEKKPVFYRRKDYPDVIYRTEEAKFRAIALEILSNNVIGRPVLVGTTSVDLSERLSKRLRAEPLRRLIQVQLLRDAWFRNNDREPDGRRISELVHLDEPLDKLEVSQLRKMARDLEISFSLEEQENVERLLSLFGLTTQDKERFAQILQAGISHEVLNARKHTEESQIITGAGAFGAVTIATNMAGRGVDIKLGGELAEEHMVNINRVLKKVGHEDAYDMNMEQRRQALKVMDPAEWGIYESEVSVFLQQMEDMEKVKALGGLHVIGSERHEARRIDNQLRGRAARQGDPGSSRFFLSLQDELMMRFGGQQVDNIMQRFQVDESLPMEFNVVSRIVESSQTRVEGANFDVRKHLLEYDDVLNTQRAAIYAQRDRIFVKDDLSEDIADMLHTEINRRVPDGLDDVEGPWKLLAWLEQAQPSRQAEEEILPSYTIKLLIEKLEKLPLTNRQELITALIEIASESLDAEAEHINNTINQLIEQTKDRIDAQIRERQEALDMFLEGLNLDDDETPRGARLLSDSLSSTLRIPIRLNAEQVNMLEEKPRQAKSELMHLVEEALTAQAIRRIQWAIIRRMEENISLDTSELAEEGWEKISYHISDTVKKILERRRERLIGKDGSIQRDLENATSQKAIPSEHQARQTFLINMLLLMTQGMRAAFDKRTHRRVQVRTIRLNYVFYAAHLLENREPEEITANVLQHLETTQIGLQKLWGQSEWKRLSTLSPSELSKRMQYTLRQALSEDTYLRVQTKPLNELATNERQIVKENLGQLALTEVYRRLLLSVITELWVDYLTQMEALRISISLESYAQRDPLVQYKSQAFELYQTLLTNTRAGVISRIFTARPSEANAPQATSNTKKKENDKALEKNTPAVPNSGKVIEKPISAETATSLEAMSTEKAIEQQGKKKRRRRRH